MWQGQKQVSWDDCRRAVQLEWQISLVSMGSKAHKSNNSLAIVPRGHPRSKLEGGAMGRQAVSARDGGT